jgi:hypothetical protein
LWQKKAYPYRDRVNRTIIADEFRRQAEIYPELRKLSEAVAEAQCDNAAQSNGETAKPEAHAPTPEKAEVQKPKLTPRRWIKAGTAFSKPPTSWKEIDITFLSDHQVQIRVGSERRAFDYAELGLADQRNGTPNLAWNELRKMAGNGGSVEQPLPSAGNDIAKREKRIEELREKLRYHFEIESDPIPFNDTAYQTSFKLTLRPSFDT